MLFCIIAGLKYYNKKVYVQELQNYKYYIQ